MASPHITLRLELRIYPWQWAVLELMYAPHQINNLRAMCGPRQLTRHAYPGQASTRARTPVRPCSCTYYVITPPPGTDHVVIPGRREGGYAHTHILGPLRCPVASLFIVDYWCPHHGYAGA